MPLLESISQCRKRMLVQGAGGEIKRKGRRWCSQKTKSGDEEGQSVEMMTQREEREY